MVPENTAGHERAQMHGLSHEQLPLLAAMRPPSPPVHTRLLPSLGMERHQVASYPASQSTGPMGPGLPEAWKPSASRSPLTGESRSELSPWTTYMPPEVSTPFSGRLPSVAAIFPSAPTLQWQTSASSRPNFHSQCTNPPAPISTHSLLERSSPTTSEAPAPLPAPKWPHPPFGTTDPVCIPPGIVGERASRREAVSIWAAVQPESTPPGMIPCYLDLQSGSSSQAEKRKANSNASRRFRSRKRNEMEMEQKITAQEDEIRKQSDALHRQAQEIEALLREWDFYRAERDFYRENLARLVPASQLQARPTSPRPSSKPFWSPL
ncbi:hypothetical protein BJX96DRAFT_178827 [Aspergillus floccosus]